MNVSRCLAERFVSDAAESKPLLQIVVSLLFTHTTHVDGTITSEAQQLSVECYWVLVVCLFLVQVPRPLVTIQYPNPDV